MNEQLLRRLPKVDELKRAPQLETLAGQYSDAALTGAIRQVIGDLRQEILNGTVEALPDQEELCRRIVRQLHRDAMPSLRPVINGTGIVLHTNLGRACLSKRAAAAAAEVAKNYSTLEYNVSTGGRGTRYSHVEAALCRLTGAESALVVNNNAAAVLLVLSALTQGGEVITSRGELVEIGGAFRVPDIMEACGAKLKEIGTTNKTHLRDYENAIGPDTRALMKVHTSNYRIVGFTEVPERADIVELAHSKGLPVIEDLGSGCLVNLERFGIYGEPTVQAVVRAGVDVLSFSGDKLLGGPQAGIIVGRKELVDKLKKHPLTRAMRVDKMTLAALEATLYAYENGLETEIPTIGMLAQTPEVLHQKATLLADGLSQAGVRAEVVPTEGQVGGGSVPTQLLRSYAVAFDGDVQTLEQKLRLGDANIIGRIHADRYLLDVRTLWEDDYPVIIRAIKEAMA